MSRLLAPTLRLLAGALAAAVVFAVVEPALLALALVAAAALYQVKPAHWRALPELAAGFVIAAAILLVAHKFRGG